MDLRVFSATKLHAALTESGDGPSFRTVRRWVEGKATPSKADEQAVLAVLGAQQNAHPEQPEWARAMEERLSDQLSRNHDLIGALGRPELFEAAERVIERLEALEPPDDEAPRGSGAVGGRAATVPPSQGRG